MSLMTLSFLGLADSEVGSVEVTFGEIGFCHETPEHTRTVRRFSSSLPLYRTIISHLLFPSTCFSQGQKWSNPK